MCCLYTSDQIKTKTTSISKPVNAIQLKDYSDVLIIKDDSSNACDIHIPGLPLSKPPFSSPGNSSPGSLPEAQTSVALQFNSDKEWCSRNSSPGVYIPSKTSLPILNPGPLHASCCRPAAFLQAIHMQQ